MNSKKPKTRVELMLRVPPWLRYAVNEMAYSRRMSANQLCLNALTALISPKDRYVAEQHVLSQDRSQRPESRPERNSA